MAGLAVKETEMEKSCAQSWSAGALVLFERTGKPGRGKTLKETDSSEPHVWTFCRAAFLVFVRRTSVLFENAQFSLLRSESSLGLVCEL